MKTPAQSPAKGNGRVYRLQPAPSAPTSLPALRLQVDRTAGLKAPLPKPQPLHPTEFPTPPAGKSVIKVGLDLDLLRLTATIQWDHLQPKAARDFKSPAALVAWVQEMTSAGHVVYTVYESCGFGYCLHYDLKLAGAISLVITPTLLDRARRRKNDRLDSAQLCLRLSRYVDGQLKELHVIRVPSVSEQQRRETGRQRAFWRGLILTMANHGRALRLEHEGKSLSGHWWGPRVWPRLEPQLTPFVRGFLEPLREQILQAQAQLDTLTLEVERRVAHEKIPKGLGPLTLALADAEVCDWFRFADSQGAGQLHRLLSLREKFRRPATHRAHRPARQRALAHAAGRGGVATGPLEPDLARLSQTGRPAQRGGQTAQALGRGAGPPTGGGPVARAHRPQHLDRTGLFGNDLIPAWAPRVLLTAVHDWCC
jgi:hypothetical protein